MSVSDKISMEYEARTMITEEQYLVIKNDYTSSFSYRNFTNINTYFDTDDLFLTTHHAVLRIREVENSKELTLKIGSNNGSIEITKNDVDFDKNLMQQLSDTMVNHLNTIGVDINKLKKITTLKTERIEIDIEDHVFVIDKNEYNNKVDYNLEVESSSDKKAYDFLLEISKKYGIAISSNYISKSRRAIYKL